MEQRSAGDGDDGTEQLRIGGGGATYRERSLGKARKERKARSREDEIAAATIAESRGGVLSNGRDSGSRKSQAPPDCVSGQSRQREELA